MHYDTLPGSDKPVSRLVYGAMMAIRGEVNFQLLDDIFALGCTAYDTAHIYEDGEVDRKLGEWINARGIRDQVYIIGKAAHPNRDRRRVTPYDITGDIYDSLARMKVDSMDMLLLHRDDPNVPVGPIMETLNEHLQAGRIHAYGGSNWTVERLKEANAYCAEHGLQPFVASSVQYSLAEMVEEPWANCLSISGPKEQSARDWYQQQNMALFTWSSLAGGFFSGRFRRDNLDTFSEYLDSLCVKSYCYEENFKRLDRAEQLAADKGLSLPQIALAYVLSQPLNIFALVGCQTKEEFAQNVTAMELKLTPEELAWLDLRSDTASVTV